MNFASCDSFATVGLYILLSFSNKFYVMKYLILLLLVPVMLFSCRWKNKIINGNGKIVTESRTVSKAEKIKLEGSFDVEITQGESTSVSIETDENLQPYIILKESDNQLSLKERSNYNLKSDQPIKVKITTPKLSKITLSGSGSIIGKNKFTGMDKLSINLTGSGDINLAINTPDLDVNIAGVGTLVLSGETKNARFDIAGSGDCDASILKTENTKVDVAGIGTVKVFAEVLLDVNVAGSGTVYYKGAATVKQKIAGIGTIKKMD